MSPDDQTDQPQTGLAGLSSLIPPLPAHESRVTSESGTSTPVATPAYQAAIGDVGANAKDQGDVLAAKGKVDAGVAKSTADAIKSQVDAFDKASADKEAEDLRQTENIKRSADILKQANAELKAAPSPSLFHDKDTWGNVAKAIALAVGSFGDALAAKGASLGNHAAPPSAVNEIIANAVQQDKDKIAKLKDDQVIAMTGVKDAVQARDIALAKEDMKGAEALKRAQLMGDYMVKAAGPQQAIYQSRLDALNLKQEADKFRAQSLASLNKTVTSRGSSEDINRDQTAPKSIVPTTLTIPMIGADLPVDPTKTDQRQHNSAVEKIPAALEFLKLTKDALDRPVFGPPEIGGVTAMVGIDTSAQAAAKASAVAARKAYAVANGESINEASEKSTAIIPDPPTSLSSKETVDAYRARMRESQDKMIQHARQIFANAGVPKEAADGAVAKVLGNDLPPTPGASGSASAPRRAAAVVPGAPAAPVAPQPTKTATNPTTGQRMGLVGGKWVPI